MHLTLTMTKTFLRLFSRDRQAIFFSLFFPIIFMSVFGLLGNAGNEPMQVGVVNNAGNPLAAEFIADLGSNPLFEVTEGLEDDLRAQVISGDVQLVLVLPAEFQDNGSPADLKLLVDASQVRQLATVMPVLEQALVDVEREMRNTEPLFNLQVEDIKARSQSYLDFLVPGLLAFTIMQISIAGSGYNIVEFRRKGILKRLFVTPLEPRNFIGALVLSRTIICLIQITVLLAVAVFLLGVNIAGSFAALYVVIILGIALFLSMGFCLGSVAKTQQAIGAMGSLFTFPQMFLAGIFYPIDILPELIQPVAQLLPLSFVANGLREIAVNGASLLDIVPTIVGLIVWAVVSLLLAIRMFVWKEVAA
ncbi:MAG: ABC transporter permease [Pseudomonadota bacterium]